MLSDIKSLDYLALPFFQLFLAFVFLHPPLKSKPTIMPGKQAAEILDRYQAAGTALYRHTPQIADNHYRPLHVINV